MDANHDYTVRLRPLADGVPVAVRFRRLLKAALRSYRMRCIEIVELPAVRAPAPNEPRVA